MNLAVCALAQAQWDDPQGCQDLLDYWQQSEPKHSAERLIGALAAQVAHATVVDLGCGPGRLVPHLGDFVSYTGYDTCQTLLAVAEATYQHDARVAFIARDLRVGAQYSTPVDLALSIDTSRHYHDPLGFLSAIVAGWPARVHLVSVLHGDTAQELMNGQVVATAELETWLAQFRVLGRAEQDAAAPLHVSYLLLAVK